MAEVAANVETSSDMVVTALGDSHTVGVFLEEVSYFLEDMKRDLWWLLRAAQQPSGQVFFRGDEELEAIAADKETIIQNLKQRFQQHVDTHENQVRSKIAIVPSVTQEELEVLTALRKLKFHCQGMVDVFLCMKEANNAAIWAAYHNYVSTMQPQWIVPSDGAGQRHTFGQCAVIVPVYSNAAKKEIKLLHVYCPDRKKRHWAFMGGDILRGTDRNLYDSARRKFREGIGMFFGRDWRECFEVELPTRNDELITDSRAVQFVTLEKDGVRFPCRPYFFVQVTEEFFDSTRAYEDAQGVIKLPKPEAANVRWDDLEHANRVHLDGVAFVEHDEARWLNVDFDTGRLWSDDNRQLRRENVDLMKQQPEKLWAYFAALLGVEAPVRAPQLPTDYTGDGSFAVRMSGIDKTATNEDIAEFFESGGAIKTISVKQFDIPKHTARVEFEDLKMLELALGLSGHTLLRRKVKVEVWSEIETKEDSAAGARPLQPYDGPLPDEAPFKCMCRGLDRTVTRDCLGYFFWDRDCKVHDVEFPIKNERHAGAVEFQEKEDLRKALSLNNAVFRGREMTIELYDGKSVGQSGGGGGGGRRDNDRSERRDKGKGGGKGGGKRDSGFDRDREPPSRAEFGSERPKLQLKPRSVPMGQDGGDRGGFSSNNDRGGFNNNNDRDHRGGYSGGGYAEPTHDKPAQQRSKPDPFGGARPRDDRFKATRADNDDNWRR